MKAPFAIMPNCWNYNDTMDAASTCRTPRGGAVIKFCMELGFTTTAFIMECANKWNGNSHCGTFLEVHRVDPDRACAAAGACVAPPIVKVNDVTPVGAC